jgi:hypothetical protein
VGLLTNWYVLTKYTEKCVLYRGEDCVEKFIKCMKAEKKYINKIIYKNESMRLINEDLITFEKCKLCHIREKPLGNDRIRDHCHIRQI